MSKVARVQDWSRGADPYPANLRRIRRVRHRYYAFLSYSHKDKDVADWLHRALEDFHVPSQLAGRLTEHGVIPKRLKPIFRDRHELAAANDLEEEIREALQSSQYLLVLCSPDAAKSRWTNAEIDEFKRTRPEGCVLAAIIAGEPFASEVPGREGEECFPPALRQKYDRRGRPTGKRAEPIAADLRDSGDGRRMGLLKLVAGMLDIGLDELVQRDATRRHRRLGYLAAASLAGMALTSGLAITAIQARDSARDQRREAEGLVAFMLGDLKDKLEPIGKLDALDGVGSRVLSYYSKQDTAELSDASLLQRSRALSLMAEVANLRGHVNEAQRLYREASAGTAEALRRSPDDAQRLFEHAQNVYWIGEIARQRGDISRAEAGMREYQRLADRMVALDPNNMRWRMESQYAEFDLGIIFFDQHKFAEAAALFSKSLQTIHALASADPKNRDYQIASAESLAWLADAQSAEGRIAEATATRARHVALLNELKAQSRNDVAFSQKLVPAEEALGNLYEAGGQMALALQHLNVAREIAEQLVRIEPSNSLWIEYEVDARQALAGALFLANRMTDATSENEAGCATLQRLISRNGAQVVWRAGWRNCLVMRAQIAVRSGSPDSAIASAKEAVQAARSVKSSDVIADAYALARSYRLLGDAQQRAGDVDAARRSWSDAMAALPTQGAERPAEAAQRLAILQRLGRRDEARGLEARLNSMGFRMRV